MWNCTTQPLDDYRGLSFLPRCDGLPIPYADVLQYWQNDESFRSFFLSLLFEARLSAYRFETPPITSDTADRAFEFVLLDAPGLDRPADDQAFADRFSSGANEQSVVTFANLGNDAVLVVPCPSGPVGAYAHLAAFVRGASAPQQHELWRAVGASMQARLAISPVWLSTAGMGVSWLHVRLDSRPKYYGYAPYRRTS